MIKRLPLLLSASKTECYTHTGDPVTLVPSNFYNEWDKLAVAENLSIDHAVWDHGDGTFSKSLTSTHQYKHPGTYSANLIVYDNFGTQHRSTSSVSITALDYINNDIIWKNRSDIFNIPASTKKWYPLKFEVFNSWQTWPAVSGSGYTLHLHASGSKSEKLNTSEYYSDKWSHLRKIWTFHRTLTAGGMEHLVPIEDYNLRLSTKQLYLSSYTDGGTVNKILTESAGPSSVFVGTSATAEFYYYDETPKNFSGLDDPVLIFVSLNTEKFLGEHIGSVPETLDLASRQTVIVPVRIRSSYSTAISINGNGVPSFQLPKTVWENSMVPFFICYTDENGNVKENFPPLEITTDRVYRRDEDLNKISLKLVNKDTGNQLAADFYSGGWSDELPDEVSGYYRGYFIPRETSDNVELQAESYLVDMITADREFYNAYFVSPPLSAVFFVQKPNKRMTYSEKPGIGYARVIVKESDTTNITEHEVYPVCVVPDQTVEGLTFDRSYVYVGDADSRRILKLNYEAKVLDRIKTIEDIVDKHFPPRDTSLQPEDTDVDPIISRIASDSESNLWVTLYDSISSFKIDPAGNLLKTVTNVDLSKYHQSSTSYMLSEKVVDTSKPINEGLIGTWSFSQAALDKSGNKFHGDVHGATHTKDRHGNIDSAYYFDGNDDWIEIPDYNESHDEWTIALWVKDGGQQQNYQALVQTSDPRVSGGTDAALYIQPKDRSAGAGGQLFFWPSPVTTSANIEPGVWTHVACSFKKISTNTGRIQYYINGIPVEGADWYIPAGNVKYWMMDHLSIGAGFQNDSEAFEGSLDEVRVYHRVLTDAEVLTLATSESPRAKLSIHDIGTPACCETDVFNGVWIGNDALTGSYAHNYNREGQLVRGFNLSVGQFIYDMVVSNDNSLWMTTYYDRGTRPTLIDLTDKIDEILVAPTPGQDAKMDIKIVCKDDLRNDDVLLRDRKDVIEIEDSREAWLNNLFLASQNVDQMALSADKDVLDSIALDDSYKLYPKSRNIIHYRCHAHASMYYHELENSIKKIKMRGHLFRYHDFEGPVIHNEAISSSTQSGMDYWGGYGTTPELYTGGGYNESSNAVKLTVAGDASRIDQWNGTGAYSIADLVELENGYFGWPSSDHTDRTKLHQGRKYRISYWHKGLTAGHGTLTDGNKFSAGVHASCQNGMGDTNNFSHMFYPRIDVWQKHVHEVVLNDPTDSRGYYSWMDNYGNGTSRNWPQGGPKRWFFFGCGQAGATFLIDEFRIEEIPTEHSTDQEEAKFKVKQSDILYQWVYKEDRLDTVDGFLYPTYMGIDLNKRIWVTHANNVLTRLIDDPLTVLQDSFTTTYYVGERDKENVPATYNMNLQFQNHDGLSVNMSNELYVLDNFSNKVYVIDTNTGLLKTSTPIITPAAREQLVSKESFQDEWTDTNNLYYQAIGDWNGVRWFHKYRNNAVDVRNLTGKATFDVLPASGQYHVRKVNENHDCQETLKSYCMQENLLRSTNLFEKFLGQSLGVETSPPNELGKKTYERIANFIPNHSDPTTCNLESLKSTANLLNIQIDSSYNYTYPSDIRRVMDLVSVEQQKLWGSRSKFIRNFHKPLSAINLGEQIDIGTYEVTPGVPIIAHELFSDTHILVVPKFLGYNLNVDLKYSKVTEYKYPLSAYGTLVENGIARQHSWNWTLDETVTGMNIGTHYEFYEFKNQPSNVQKEGIINWADKNNTIKESQSSADEWEKDDGIIDRMIEFELRKHLDLFSQNKYTIPIHPSIKFGVQDSGLVHGGQFNLGSNVKSGVAQVTPELIEGAVPRSKPYVQTFEVESTVGEIDPTNLTSTVDQEFTQSNPGIDQNPGSGAPST